MRRVSRGRLGVRRTAADRSSSRPPRRSCWSDLHTPARGMCHPRRALERPDYYGNPARITEDVDVVRAIYAAFADRDLERALEYIDPACEIHLVGTARR